MDRSKISFNIIYKEHQFYRNVLLFFKLYYYSKIVELIRVTRERLFVPLACRFVTLCNYISAEWSERSMLERLNFDPRKYKDKLAIDDENACDLSITMCSFSREKCRNIRICTVAQK